MTNTRITGSGRNGSPSAGRRPLASPSDREAPRGLRATIDLAPVGICHFGSDGRLLLVNRRFADMLGLARERLLGRTLQALSAPTDAQALAAVIARMLTGDLPSYTGEHQLLRADGASIWARLSLAVVPDDDGTVAFLTGVADDISAERQQGAARREAEERLHAALQASTIGTFRWDVRTNALSWDENLDALFGLPPGSTVHTLDEFIARVHPSDRDRVRAACGRCAITVGLFEEEFRIVRSDGEERWIYDKGRTFADADGVPTYMTGACTDVTARRQMEQELRASEARLRRITDSGMIGVFYSSATQDITDANDAFLGMLGYTREDLEARRLNGHELTPSTWHEPVARHLAAALADGVAGPWEQEFIARDGHTIPVLVAHARLDEPRDQCIGICLDISETKHAEAEREQLLVSEQEARRRAEEATQLRDEVLGVVAHDLRNPVHSILMSASALAELMVPEDQRKRHIAIIRRTARQMDRLIRDLLDVRRMEAGTLEVRCEPVNIAELMTETVEGFESEARSRGLTLGSDVGTDLPPVIGDRDRLGQVLSNLIGNALKFTPRGGSVGVHAHHVNGYVELSVTDNGPGIPPRILSTVFDRFWQADRSSGTGAGLGLAIARGIVEAHRGHIWVESIVGHGTAFRFTVPCTDPDAPVEVAMAP